MIDGESSKDELLQSSKCSSGRRLLDQNQTRFDTEAAAEAGRFYSYTKRAFTG